MKPICNAIFFLAMLLCPSFLYAQTDSLKHKKDSVINARLNQQLNQVQQLSAERLADSLRRVELETQVAGLTAVADKFKKAVLLQELNTLKQNDSARVIRQRQQVDSLRKYVKGYAVAPFTDTLFYLYTRQGSFTAGERAAAISKRLAALGDDYSFRPDSLKLSSSEQTADILFKNNVLVAVSDQDALWANMSKESLAKKYRSVIALALVKYQHENSLQTLLKESSLALLVIIVVVLLIYGVNRLFKWLTHKAASAKAWYTNGIHIRNYELMDAGQQLNALYFVIKVFRWLLIILTVYLALPVLFGIFPFTRDISGTLLGYVTTPLQRIGLAIWNYVPNLVTILVLIIIFRYVLRFINYLKSEVATGRLTIPGFYTDWANPTYQIIRVLVLAFMVIVIFPYLPGSDSAVFKGVSVFVGILFTFGSAGALGNVVAGLVLTYMRAFKLGDRVKIGEVSGDIIEKTLLVTRIRTIQNEIISVPNSTVLNSHTLNYSSEAQERGLILHTTVTIGYDSPWRQVHQLLIDAALDTPMIAKEPLPYVLQTGLDDYYVSYRINAYTKEPNKQILIYSFLHQNIQDRFNQAGVEIMSPHYKALRDGNATTIPPDYLPKDYIAPAFITKQQKESGK